MAATPSSGSTTSPVPDRISVRSLSATTRSASSRRRNRSVRQSLASSTAARDRFLLKSFSFPSKRSNRVKASAVAPAKPATTDPSPSRRGLRATRRSGARRGGGLVPRSERSGASRDPRRTGRFRTPLRARLQAGGAGSVHFGRGRAREWGLARVPPRLARRRRRGRHHPAHARGAPDRLHRSGGGRFGAGLRQGGGEASGQRRRSAHRPFGASLQGSQGPAQRARGDARDLPPDRGQAGGRRQQRRSVPRDVRGGSGAGGTGDRRVGGGLPRRGIRQRRRADRGDRRRAVRTPCVARERGAPRGGACVRL